jgi:hypothetical protein
VGGLPNLLTWSPLVPQARRRPSTVLLLESRVIEESSIEPPTALIINALQRTAGRLGSSGRLLAQSPLRPVRARFAHTVLQIIISLHNIMQDSLPVAGHALLGWVVCQQGHDERFQSMYLLLSQACLARHHTCYSAFWSFLEGVLLATTLFVKFQCPTASRFLSKKSHRALSS